MKSASPDQRRPRDGVALPASNRRRLAKIPGALWGWQARCAIRRPEGGVLKEPRKGGLGVSLVDAVVEPGGHYCRSSDAAVLLCVRIIALAAACVVCCGCGCGCGVATVNSGNGTEERERRERKEARKDGAFLAFSPSAPHVGEKPLLLPFSP